LVSIECLSCSPETGNGIGSTAMRRRSRLLLHIPAERHASHPNRFSFSLISRTFRVSCDESIHSEISRSLDPPVGFTMDPVASSSTGPRAPYGRACANCSRVKCRCIYQPGELTCERLVSSNDKQWALPNVTFWVQGSHLRIGASV
jgi:hypothetical protein